MWRSNFTIPHSSGANILNIRLCFGNPPIFWKSAYILRKRLNFEKAPTFWESAYILRKRLHFKQVPIFCVYANILSKRQYFDNFFAMIFCLILLLQIFVYIFSITLFMHFVCANIFGAIVLKPRFKIDVVIMIIWSIVIIINSVLTLQVLTASLPLDCEPCEIKVVFNHTWLLHTCVCAWLHRVRVRLSGLINDRNRLNSWGHPITVRVCAEHTYKFYPSGHQSHANCARVAVSRMKIVPVWPPVTCNMNKIGRNLQAATRVQFACDWRPLGYNLHATDGHWVTRQETSRQVVCKRPSLHHNYICYHQLVHILDHASGYLADGPWIFGLENALVLWMTTKG